MQTARIIEILQARAVWAVAAVIVVGLVAYVSMRRRGSGGPEKDKPALPRPKRDAATSAKESSVPFSQEEALREFAAHAKVLAGCYEELWQALDSRDAYTLRRKLSAVATRFRNMKEAPRAQAWFNRIAGDVKAADAEQLHQTAREFFAALETVGIRRCLDETVPDNDETLERYVFVGSGHPIDGGPYKVVRAAWLLGGRKVVEQGFIDNEQGHA